MLMKIKRSLLIDHLLAGVLVTFILRMALPQVRYVFYPLFIVLLVWHLVEARDWKRYRYVISSLRWYLILLGILTAAAFYHSSFIRPYLEVFNGLVLALILALIFYHVRDSARLDSFSRAFFLELFILSSATALAGLINLGVYLAGMMESVPAGESILSIGSDYNFSILAILYGLILATYYLTTAENLRLSRIIMLNAIMVVFLINILLVPSRRGVIIFLMFLLLLIALRMWVLFKPKAHRVLFRLRRYDAFLIVVLLMSWGIHIFLFSLSPASKKNFLIRSGLYRIELRKKVTDLYSRYAGMVDPDLSYRQAYYLLWDPGNNPTAHEGHAGDADEDEVAGGSPDPPPIHGGLADFRPNDSAVIRKLTSNDSDDPKAILLGAFSPEGGAQSRFYADVGDTLQISAWVKVFKWNRHLRLQVPNTDHDGNECVFVKKEWEGDGRWHRVQMMVAYDVFGTLPVWIGGGGEGERSSLSCWSRIRIAEPDSIDEGVAVSNTPPEIHMADPSTLKAAQTEPKGLNEKQDSRDASFSKSWSGLNSTRLLQPLQGCLLKDTSGEKAPLFTGEWVSGAYEDDRKGRWKMALDIFRYYDPFRKITGGGLAYLPAYGKVFHDNPGHYDYPHNPLLSTLLYSGVIGAALYLFYLTAALIMHLRHLPRRGMFFLLFLLTGLFVSVSGNSHFSVPAFALFCQLPFFFNDLDKASVNG
jgi:hypothetical protein